MFLHESVMLKNKTSNKVMSTEKPEELNLLSEETFGGGTRWSQVPLIIEVGLLKWSGRRGKDDLPESSVLPGPSH